jgi:hypothetical protein
MRRIGAWLWAGPWTLVGLLLALPACAAGARLRRVDGVLEVCGGRLGERAARGVGPYGVTAVTLGHVVLGCDAATLDRLRAHERVHVRQYEAWGPLFVPAYLLDSAWQWLRGRHPYRDNRFERAARAGAAGG